MSFIVVPTVVGFAVVFYWLYTDAREKRASELSRRKEKYRKEGEKK